MQILISSQLRAGENKLCNICYIGQKRRFEASVTTVSLDNNSSICSVSSPPHIIDGAGRT